MKSKKLTKTNGNGQLPLRVDGLQISFGELEVLKGVSLSANKGEVVSILGASGSGKSTFLRCIPLLDNPTAGQIFIEGELLQLKPESYNLNKKTFQRLTAQNEKQLRKLRANLGFVFQQFNLWSHMTVMDNLIEAPMALHNLNKKIAIEKAEHYLQKVNLTKTHYHHYPIQLSGGQQQRVAIARALMMEPKVLLFDEPTSALDPELVGEVLSVMKKLAEEGRTMLVVTHEMAFARDVSDLVVFFHQGKVLEQSKPAEFFIKPKAPELQQFLAKFLK